VPSGVEAPGGIARVREEHVMSRQDRQRAQIVQLARQGERSRAVALAREHLVEFPDDSIVAGVAGSVDGHATIGDELEDLA
jgi:hypothetical protein